MDHVNTILSKLKNKEYTTVFSLNEDIKKLQLKSEHPIVKFITSWVDNKDCDTFISEYMLVKYLSRSDIFNKSLSTIIRVALYLDDIDNTNYEIYFDTKEECPTIKSVTMFDGKGTMMLKNIPNKNIINFSYARNMPKGLPTISGHVNLTQYNENTKEILDTLFSIGNTNISI
ncbi:MAG: hypothetical protein [Caudoviricetes sp.]|nr:MAG: hypothetical protein [Caudoviricetes sp.]